MKNKNLVSVIEYAKLCGLERDAIYNRIRNNIINAQETEFNGRPVIVIDTKLYPPKPAMKKGRKPFTIQ